jgi:hypothetical protein
MSELWKHGLSECVRTEVQSANDERICLLSCLSTEDALILQDKDPFHYASGFVDPDL